jgi:hypothetical protein
MLIEHMRGFPGMMLEERGEIPIGGGLSERPDKRTRYGCELRRNGPTPQTMKFQLGISFPGLDFTRLKILN